MLSTLLPIITLAVLTTAVPQFVRKGVGIPIPVTRRSGFVYADKSVNIDALNAQVASTKAKILRAFENFEKNTGTPHPAALKAFQKRTTGADPLTNDNSLLWYGSISVGTPATNFTVDFDTGSSDLFLPGPNCTSNCDGHIIYDPGASSTSRYLGQNFTLKYEDNSTVSGEQYTDTVTVAGLTASQQTLGAATEYSSSLAVDQFPPDGLMGMAFQNISKYHAPPVFQTLINQNQTDEPVFSLKLAATGSELYLGGANSALYMGNFSYTPVTVQGHWEVSMDSIEGSGQIIMSNVDSVIDTGTTLIVAPPSQAADFYNALGGTDASNTIGPGYYTFPCDSFPSVSFTFGGTPFSISEATLNLGTVSTNSSECISGIIGQDLGASFWVVGDLFLQNVYTTFDVGNLRVGFAQLA